MKKDKLTSIISSSSLEVLLIVIIIVSGYLGISGVTNSRIILPAFFIISFVFFSIIFLRIYNKKEKTLKYRIGKIIILFFMVGSLIASALDPHGNYNATNIFLTLLFFQLNMYFIGLLVLYKIGSRFLNIVLEEKNKEDYRKMRKFLTPTIPKLLYLLVLLVLMPTPFILIGFNMPLVFSFNEVLTIHRSPEVGRFYIIMIIVLWYILACVLGRPMKFEKKKVKK